MHEVIHNVVKRLSRRTVSLRFDTPAFSIPFHNEFAREQRLGYYDVVGFHKPANLVANRREGSTLDFKQLIIRDRVDPKAVHCDFPVRFVVRVELFELLVKRGFHVDRSLIRFGIVSEEFVRISQDAIDEYVCERLPGRTGVVPDSSAGIKLHSVSGTQKDH